MKIVSLKVFIFALWLLLNRSLTKYTLARRRIFATNDKRCVVSCGVHEDKDHLIVTCDFFGRSWPIIFNWLGFSTTSQGTILKHILQYGGLGGFFKNCSVDF